MTNRRLAFGSILAAAVLVAGPGCSSEGDGDIAGWCQAVEDLDEAGALAEGINSGEIDADPDDLYAARDGLESALDAVKAKAPQSITDEVALLFQADPDTKKVSEQEALADAQDEVNGYIWEKCDLDIEL